MQYIETLPGRNYLRTKEEFITTHVITFNIQNKNKIILVYLKISFLRIFFSFCSFNFLTCKDTSRHDQLNNNLVHFILLCSLYVYCGINCMHTEYISP